MLTSFIDKNDWIIDIFQQTYHPLLFVHKLPILSGLLLFELSRKTISLEDTPRQIEPEQINILLIHS